MLSVPQNDKWEIVDNDDKSQYYGNKFKFDFSFIESNSIKDIFKDFVWRNYKTQNNTLSKLYGDIYNFRYFNLFLQDRQIISLQELNNDVIESFISYLRTTISDQTKRPLSYSYQRKVLTVVKLVIRWCQLYRPDDAPQSEIFTGNEYAGINHSLKIEFIPDEVISQINKALKTEENLYVKYGVIILESTGMRIGDLLRLRMNCIQEHLISGYTILLGMIIRIAVKGRQCQSEASVL